MAEIVATIDVGPEFMMMMQFLATGSIFPRTATQIVCAQSDNYGTEFAEDSATVSRRTLVHVINDHKLETEMSEVENRSEFALGCTVTDQGVAFRVWAPHADYVSVIGEFNNWLPDADPCQPEQGGCWSAIVGEAKPGQAYKFYIRNGKMEMQRIDPRAKQVSNSVGHGLIYQDNFDWQGDNFVQPNWNELVIYELHAGSFNTVNGRVGSFASIIEKLPYLRELGINVIELMPVAEFAGDYSWGYNPAHPYAVESAYGGPDGLKELIRQAHCLGIAVIIDVVYNHFGPSDLNLWQFDGWSENNKGGIYFYNDDRSSTPWGDTRPDYGRPEVRQYILDNAMMWLEEYHADGLRYDMTLYIRSKDWDQANVIEDGFSLLRWINSETSNRFPGKITIAEDLQNNSLLTEDSEFGGGGFDAQWDARFVHPVRATIVAIEDEQRSMETVKQAILHRYNLDVFERIIYTESHDEVANGKQRVVSEIDPSERPNRYAIKRSTLGACLMMTAPGIPMLFQGQEFLRDKWFQDNIPLDWNRAQEYCGVVELYRDLIHLRRNIGGMSAGLCGQHVEVPHLNELTKIITMHRWKEGGPGDNIFVLFKFSESQLCNYRVGFPFAGKWELVFNSDARIYNPGFDDVPVDDIQTEQIAYDGYPQSADLCLGAYSCLIFARSSS